MAISVGHRAVGIAIVADIALVVRIAIAADIAPVVDIAVVDTVVAVVDTAAAVAPAAIAEFAVGRAQSAAELDFPARPQGLVAWAAAAARVAGLDFPAGLRRSVAAGPWRRVGRTGAAVAARNRAWAESPA